MTGIGKNLFALGWQEFFAAQLTEEERASASFSVARILEEHRRMYWVETSQRTLWGELPGKFYFDLAASGARPAVGDWVILENPGSADRTRILRVLNRRTKFSRNAPGEERVEQVVAANIDVAFVVTSLNLELSVRRLERYLTLVGASGAEPVIVLTKTDLVDDTKPFLEVVERAAPGVKRYTVSAKTSRGLAPMRKHLIDKTGVLLGSSGVGKSTLLNRLVGEAIQATQEVRESDDRGRHTTSARRLLKLPDGGNLIDTPGMRELQLWEAEEGIEQTFADVISYVERCKFRDCVHGNEPGCAVREAVAGGDLDSDRVGGYRKLLAEQTAATARRTKDESARNLRRGKRLDTARKKDR